MSEERMKSIAGGTGRYARPDDAQAIRNRDAAWQEVLKAEQADMYAKRKRRVVLGACLVLTAGMLLAMIHQDLINQLIGEVFLAADAAWFGYHIGK